MLSASSISSRSPGSSAPGRVYSITASRSARRRRASTREMNRYRDVWMRQMLARDMRMVDAQIDGGAAERHRVLRLDLADRDRRRADLAALDRGDARGGRRRCRSASRRRRVQWETKTMGLAMIFVYAFFKFAWSYRLYNYVAILLGAAPPAETRTRREAKAHAERVGRLCEVAGRHFNRGQRAFFFALGYLGWFVSAYVLMVSTAACLMVMWRRQFASDALAALAGPDG